MFWFVQCEEFIFGDVGRRTLVARSNGGNVEGEILGFRNGIENDYAPVNNYFVWIIGLLTRAASSLPPTGKTSRRIFLSFG